MTGSEIRERYLKYFEGKGHRRLPSASLIPANDPSILWTAAGMVPFKPFFTGTAKSEHSRITTCQKCLRTPDIESVGRTARHHTFFEMLGNFSFGDYFKKEAINWSWEFVTVELGLPRDKLWITIYLDDDEAFEIWNQEVGVPSEKIVRMDKDTNFWEIGVGPCGPCSEIYIDLGEERGCGAPDCAVGCDCDRYLEIWNLVFIQFFKDEAGEYSPLESKGIDTGMGLERVASIMQKVPTNFDTDLFREIMDFTAEIIGTKYGIDDKTDLALKVIADHCRAVTFAVADGAMPSNEGRGYVLRRLLRRAIRFGRLLGLKELFMHKVAGAVIRQMSNAYPELERNKEHVLRVVQTEEERFSETLAQGTEILNRLIQEAKTSGTTQINGNDAFRLYDTFGFPLELTKEIAEEQGLTVNEEAFAAAMEEQRRRAREARQETEYLSEIGVLYKSILDKNGPTDFTGYEEYQSEARVLALIRDGNIVDSVSAGDEVEVVLDKTPCYAESGGQVADSGLLKGQGAELDIYEVTKPVEGLHVHRGKVKSGSLGINEEVTVAVDYRKRMNIARNHSATHLLHKALKEVLGEHVNQAGSLVEPQRLRFDFTHFAAVSNEELNKIEAIVNEKILENMFIETLDTTIDKAMSMGAVALFGEKYGDQVRLVNMGEYTLELCGGTHLKSTAEVGVFKITGESSIGAGLRRIEAVTGEGTIRYFNEHENILLQISRMVKANPADVMQRVELLLKERKDLEHEAENLRAKMARFEVQNLLDQVKVADGVKYLAARASAPDMDSLRAMVDLLRDQLGSAVILLASPVGERVNLVASVTRDLLDRGLHAGKIVKEVAPVVGGGGGGRPEMAQAGGKNPSRLQEALDKAQQVIVSQLGN